FSNWTMLQNQIDISRFDTRNVKDLSYLFYYTGYEVARYNDFCLEYDFREWDTSKVTNMESMFNRFGSKYNDLKLNFGGMFTTKNVTNLQEMFALTGTYGLSDLNLGNSFQLDSCNSLRKLFYGTGEASEKWYEFELGDNFDTSRVEDFSFMFYQCGCTSLVRIDTGEKFTFESAKNLSYLFFNCGMFELTELIHPEWHCEEAEDVSFMFCGLGNHSLKRFELNDNFNVKNAVRSEGMFAQLGNESLEYFSIGNNFNCVKSENMTSMFEGIGQYTLQELDLGDNFGGDNCKSMSKMFRNAGGQLSEFSYGGHFATDKVEDFSEMFSGFGCGSKLEHFSMPEGFTGANGVDFSEMFSDFCVGGSLKTLSLGTSINTSKSLNFMSMFDNCAPNTLEVLYLGIGFDLTTAFLTRNRMKLMWLFRNCGSSETTVYGPLILTDTDNFGIEKYDLKFQYISS
ncbi:MAG: DUF285 domain-containing protein, partial [Lachnospiraceae bacterium]|nr:DUF285 domain-containing protein [Lachnospiraceae bacterium]